MFPTISLFLFARNIVSFTILFLDIAKQDELFQRYKEAIVNDLTKEKYYETEFKPREWVILGNKFNIHNPYIHWTESRE